MHLCMCEQADLINVQGRSGLLLCQYDKGTLDTGCQWITGERESLDRSERLSDESEITAGITK